MALADTELERASLQFTREFNGIYFGMLASRALDIAAGQHRALKERLAEVERERDDARAELERVIAGA